MFIIIKKLKIKKKNKKKFKTDLDPDPLIHEECQIVFIQ